MELETIITLISTVGFPIVAAIICAWFIYVCWKHNNTMIEKQNKEMSDKLQAMSDRCQAREDKMFEQVDKFNDTLNAFNITLSSIDTRLQYIERSVDKK